MLKHICARTHTHTHTHTHTDLMPGRWCLVRKQWSGSSCSSGVLMRRGRGPVKLWVGCRASRRCWRQAFSGLLRSDSNLPCTTHSYSWLRAAGSPHRFSSSGGSCKLLTRFNILPCTCTCNLTFHIKFIWYSVQC